MSYSVKIFDTQRCKLARWVMLNRKTTEHDQTGSAGEMVDNPFALHCRFHYPLS